MSKTRKFNKNRKTRKSKNFFNRKSRKSFRKMNKKCKRKTRKMRGGELTFAPIEKDSSGNYIVPTSGPTKRLLDYLNKPDKDIRKDVTDEELYTIINDGILSKNGINGDYADFLNITSSTQVTDLYPKQSFVFSQGMSSGKSRFPNYIMYKITKLEGTKYNPDNSSNSTNSTELLSSMSSTDS